MTFNQAKRKLDKLSDKQFDNCGKMLAKLHVKLLKKDKKIADALELAFMAMTLYCNK